MVAPEVPTGSLIREAVLDDQSDGQGHDPMGVAGSRPEFEAGFWHNFLLEKDFSANPAAICSQNLFRCP